jgi:hypothetical protein
MTLVIAECYVASTFVIARLTSLESLIPFRRGNSVAGEVATAVRIIRYARI